MILDLFIYIIQFYINQNTFLPGFIIRKGTLCFTIAANIADSAILGMDACFPDSIVGFLPYENVSDTTYVKYLFDELKLYFQQISKGTTQDNLSLDKICRVKLRVPDYDTQVKVASILSTYGNLL